MAAGKTMSRLDPRSREAIHRIMEVSARRGVDPVEVLNIAGLIRHPASIRDDWAQCLASLLDALQSIPAELIKPSEIPKTQLDVKNLMIAMVAKVAERITNEGDERP